MQSQHGAERTNFFHIGRVLSSYATRRWSIPSKLRHGIRYRQEQNTGRSFPSPRLSRQPSGCVWASAGRRAHHCALKDVARLSPGNRAMRSRWRKSKLPHWFGWQRSVSCVLTRPPLRVLSKSAMQRQRRRLSGVAKCPNVILRCFSSAPRRLCLAVVLVANPSAPAL